MPEQNKFDSGHVILPFLHSSGEVHNIALPEDMHFADIHDALMNGGYEHNPIPSSPKEPTKEGAVENSPEFRKASEEAWEKSGYGNRAEEAGFVVDKTGKPGKVKEEQDPSARGGEMEFQTSPGEMVVHTHSDPYVRHPSSGDVESAKKTKTNVYAITKDGLWLVEPDGKVNQIYKKDDWMTRKKPE